MCRPPRSSPSSGKSWEADMSWLASLGRWLTRIAGEGERDGGRREPEAKPSAKPNPGAARENGNGASRERDSWKELDEREISDVMIHRTVMKGINADDPPEIVVKAILESHFTR